MPIHILPAELASKIAAGEVIERPASVVKELVENSIDAHAREIKLEARGGGQRLIRVMDDGDGIPGDQVALAFERHATSKLDQIDDLQRLTTLGFRGEALPSIAAVSRVTLITHARGENAGTLIRVDGGRILAQQPHGSPVGTIVTVEDLFQHVPARLKFLKAVSTEAAQIAELTGAFAMAYPHLRFLLLNEGRLTFQTSGTGKLLDVLVKIFGAEVARQMIPIGAEGGPANGGRPDARPEAGIKVTGYVSPPAVNRSTRKYVYIYVNGRWIEDRSIAHAIIEAYHTLLMVGRFPIAVVHVTVPPDMVDVNVHPTKGQVRFRETNEIYHAVQRVVRGALVSYAPVPSVHPAPLRPRDGDLGPPLFLDGSLAPALPHDGPFTAAPAGSGPASAAAPSLAPVDSGANRLPMLRVLGQLGSTYILAEGPDGMYVIDQHAAHERVLFERLKGERGRSQVLSQTLLDPVTVTLTPVQFAVYQRESAGLRECGLQIEEFGGQSVLVRALPVLLKQNDPRRVLAEVLDDLGEGNAPFERAAEERLITSICKSAAIKGGQVLSLDEMRELIRQLEQTSSPRTCPHGRPTVVRFDLSLLEREFGRK